MEHISVLDMLKIGVGPSSSHTMGPWKAALRFIEMLESANDLPSTIRIEISLYGSLALTGIGHGTLEALILGLSGFDPRTIPMKIIKSLPDQIKKNQTISLSGRQQMHFNIKEDILFHPEVIPSFHSNGLNFKAYDSDKQLFLDETFYSIGGGFIVQENVTQKTEKRVPPYPITFAKDLKNHCIATGQTMSWIIRENEKSWLNEEQFEKEVLLIYQVMLATVYRGCHHEGTLPGGLNVQRRASALFKKITAGQLFEDTNSFIAFLKNSDFKFKDILKLVSCMAIATNEENADFGRVVTAPTNGAAGVIPAVLLYHLFLSKEATGDKSEIVDFFCVASEIGSIFKKKSTISAAMGGCQAEIGVSSAMAAAALTHVSGGSIDQVLMAAEIAMEHHLGLTCDPIGGLVQVPCIERNSMGAIKAITASQLALGSDPSFAKVSLDDVVKTMWETAQDMNHKYKETALGGLATNYSVSLPEC